MEALTELIRVALNRPGLIAPIGVYLGPENRNDQRELPRVILIPEGAEIDNPQEPRPNGRGQIVTDVMAESVSIHAYATTYQDARLLALNTLAAIRLSVENDRVRGSLRYADIDDARPVRVAVLTVSVDYTLSLGRVVLAELNEIIEHCHLIPKEDLPYVR